MPLEKLTSSCALCAKQNCNADCQMKHWKFHKTYCKTESFNAGKVEEGSLANPLMSALDSQIEKYVLEVKDDVAYFLAIPYIPLLFDGIGLPLYIHLNFTFKGAATRGGVRSQFHCEFARQTNQREYLEWTRQTAGPQSASDEARTWEHEASEDARKPKLPSPSGRPPARVRLIFTAETIQADGHGFSAVHSMTTRMGNATPSALDKRNAHIDWTAPLMTFLNGAKAPLSIARRLLVVLEHFGLAKDPTWVAQAAEQYAIGDPMLKGVAQRLKGGLGTPHSVEVIYYCMEFDWNR